MAKEMENAIKGNPIEDIRNVAIAGDAALAAAILGNTEPADTVTVADTANRYTGTNVETCLAEIAGASRTTETVKGNNTLIVDHKNNVSGAHTAGAISIVDSLDYFTGTDVEAALIESISGKCKVSTHSFGTIESVSGLTVKEYGDAAVHKTILTLANVVMDVTDGANPDTDGAWGTKKLYTFPQGHVQILGAHFVSPIGGMVAASTGSGLTDTADFEIGVGTVASGNESVFGLKGTQQNIVAAITTELTASATTAIKSGVTTTPGNNYDGSTTAIPVNLNMRTSGDADSGTGASTLTVSGTLTILWSVLGNN